MQYDGLLTLISYHDIYSTLGTKAATPASSDNYLILYYIIPRIYIPMLAI